MYIILNWSDLDCILPCMNEDGSTMLFESEAEAKEYTKELNENWKIVEI